MEEPGQPILGPERGWLKVSFTDNANSQESLTSAATAAVLALSNTPATGQTTISGTTQAGQTLTVKTTGIEDADRLNNAAYTYQWLADEGKTIAVRVSFTDDADSPESLSSEPTAAVAAPAGTADRQHL